MILQQERYMYADIDLYFLWVVLLLNNMYTVCHKDKSQRFIKPFC